MVPQNKNESGCGFFQWLDPPTCTRSTKTSTEVMNTVNEIGESEVQSPITSVNTSDYLVRLVASESLQIKLLLRVIVLLLCLLFVLFFYVLLFK